MQWLWIASIQGSCIRFRKLIQELCAIVRQCVGEYPAGYDPVVKEDSHDIGHTSVRGCHCSCELGITISHDYQELVAFFRLQRWTKNVHGHELEWAAGWEEFLNVAFVSYLLVEGTLAAIVYFCVNIVGHLWPVYLAAHGVVHALLLQGIEIVANNDALVEG